MLASIQPLHVLLNFCTQAVTVRFKFNVLKISVNFKEQVLFNYYRQFYKIKTPTAIDA